MINCIGVIGPPRSLVNTNALGGCCSRCSLRRCRISSPRMGCVAGLPFLKSGHREICKGALCPLAEYSSRNPTLDNWPCLHDQLRMRDEVVPRSLSNLFGLNVCEPYPLFLEFFLDRSARQLASLASWSPCACAALLSVVVSGYAVISLDHGFAPWLGLEPCNRLQPLQGSLHLKRSAHTTAHLIIKSAQRNLFGRVYLVAVLFGVCPRAHEPADVSRWPSRQFTFRSPRRHPGAKTLRSRSAG